MNETVPLRFRVVDKQTGKEPDLRKIALEEEWAKRLMYCDMEGFGIQWDGALILCDECGAFAYCPEGRFQVIFGCKKCGRDLTVDVMAGPALIEGTESPESPGYCRACVSEKKEGNHEDPSEAEAGPGR